MRKEESNEPMGDTPRCQPANLLSHDTSHQRLERIEWVRLFSLERSTGHRVHQDVPAGVEGDEVGFGFGVGELEGGVEEDEGGRCSG
jgi:hypothetical protein